MRTWDTVAIVGVGLIGGSIGLALRDRKLAREVVGISRRAATLRVAKRRGAVTRVTSHLETGVSGAELVILCTPVEVIATLAREVSLACPEQSLITDAGSTKEDIVLSVEHAFSRHNPRQAVFVGSHPMAGSEKNGPQHASADLFEGCMVAVTPSKQTKVDACRVVERFWKSLGAKTLRMDPKEHDRAVAAISHVPHLVASLLAAATPASALPLAAGGWRDTTRIASSDPQLWKQILSQNRWNVLESLEAFARNLAIVRRALTYNDRDQLTGLLEKGKEIRDSCGVEKTKKKSRAGHGGNSK